jgi:tRNA A37 methylthiotransferase MiaB
MLESALVGVRRGREKLKVGMIGLGCAKNLVDGEIMLGHLAERGAEITPDIARADVVIVNKVDLLAHTDFSFPAAVAAVRDVHPGVAVLTTSCRSGEGVDDVVAWLEWRIAAKPAAAPPAAVGATS